MNASVSIAMKTRGSRTGRELGDSMKPMAQEFDVVIERDEEGVFVATVPALPGCHTQARSLDELMERVKEAILLCLEVGGAPPQSLDFVGVQRIRVA